MTKYVSSSFFMSWPSSPNKNPFPLPAMRSQAAWSNVADKVPWCLSDDHHRYVQLRFRMAFIRFFCNLKKNDIQNLGETD